MQYHEVTILKDLDAFGFEDSSFLFNSDEVLEEEKILLEDDTCQEDVV